MSKEVRLAFVGCGRATSELHLPALQRNGEIAVAAVCDSDTERLRTAGERAPQARRYSALRELLADPEIDAVAVCTPPQDHARHAIAALDAGKHVFIEKPLALTLADCDALVSRAAQQSDRHVVVGFNLRQHRLLLAARAAVATGALGGIELVRSVFTTDIRLTRKLPPWRDARAAGGGVVSELATHHFDLWRWLLRDEVSEVSALSRDGGSDDSAASVSARLRSGALASLEMSERTTPVHQIEIFAERGHVRVSLYDFDGYELVPQGRAPGSIAARVYSVVGTLRALPDGMRGLTNGGDYKLTFAREWRAFAATVLRGSAPAATVADGAAAARIARAAADSIAQRCTIPVAAPG